MPLPFARTVPARKRAPSFGNRIMPWAQTRDLELPSPLFLLAPASSLAPGIYGCMSTDGVYHATCQLRDEWEAAKAVLSGVPS